MFSLYITTQLILFFLSFLILLQVRYVISTSFLDTLYDNGINSFSHMEDDNFIPYTQIDYNRDGFSDLIGVLRLCPQYQSEILPLRFNIDDPNSLLARNFFNVSSFLSNDRGVPDTSYYSRSLFYHPSISLNDPSIDGSIEFSGVYANPSYLRRTIESPNQCLYFLEVRLYNPGSFSSYAHLSGTTC
jgi:hypothetical protein